MITQTYGGALFGVDAQLISIEVNIVEYIPICCEPQFIMLSESIQFGKEGHSIKATLMIPSSNLQLYLVKPVSKYLECLYDLTS